MSTETTATDARVDGIVINQCDDGWTGHGCKFKGPVVVADYQACWESNPKFGRFAAMTIYDALDKAKAAVQEQHGEFTTFLAIPILVVRID